MLIPATAKRFSISTLAMLILAAQCTFGIPTQTQEKANVTELTTTTTESSHNKVIVSTIKYFTDDLLVYNIEEIEEFLNKSYKPLKAFFENIIQAVDAYNSADKSELKKKIKPLELDLEELKELDNAENVTWTKYVLLEDIAVHLDALLNATAINQLNKEDDIFLANILQQYGLKEMIEERNKNAQEFMKIFKDRAYEFWQPLPLHERGELDFEAWFKDFEQDSGIYENFALFRKVNHFYPHALFYKRKTQ